MKSQTEARYRDRVNEAVRILSMRLSDPPSAEELARAVGVSPFHFQRLYRAATGESLLETLTRLRAVRSLELLAARQQSITDIAAEVGYETPQAFARAFRDWTGMTPSEARDRAGQLKARFETPSRNEEAAVEIRIVSLEPVTLTVIHTRQPFGPLNAVYEALFDTVSTRGRLGDVRGIYGLPVNDPLSEPDRSVAHIAALHVEGSPVGDLDVWVVNGGLAAHARHIGPFEEIDQTSLRLYRSVLEDDLSLADHPPLHHHLDDPDDVPAAALRTDIYLFLNGDQEIGEDR